MAENLMVSGVLTPAGRALAAGIAAATAPGRDFVVTVALEGQPPLVHIERFASSMDAVIAVLERQHGQPGKVDIRPVIEVSEAEGYSRWPEPLHANAFAAAVRGWNLARVQNGKDWCVYQAERASEANDARALKLQIDRAPNGGFLHG